MNLQEKIYPCLGEAPWSLDDIPRGFNTPFEAYNLGRALEPHLNVKTSRQFLEEYPNTTTAKMEMAKQYWLDYQTSFYQRDAQEKLRREEFPEEAENIGLEVWRWHLLVRYENSFCGGYHLSASDRRYSRDTIKHLYPKDPNCNLANINIFSKLNIPEDFTSFSAYSKLGHDDNGDALKGIRNFPEISIAIAKAKEYWLQETSIEEANIIKNDYHHEVEKFRELLWKRHLMIEGRRVIDCVYAEELRQEAEKKNNRVMMIGAAFSVAVVSIVFFYSSNSAFQFVCRQLSSAPSLLDINTFIDLDYYQLMNYTI